MHSSTTAYIQLQNLYKDQYRADLAEFRAVLDDVLSKVGLPSDIIPIEEIESFVKNSSGVAIVKGTPLAEDDAGRARLKEAIGEPISF